MIVPARAPLGKGEATYSVSESDLSSNLVVLSVTLGGWTISAVCGRALHPTVGFADAGGSAETRADAAGIGGE